MVRKKTSFAISEGSWAYWVGFNKSDSEFRFRNTTETEISVVVKDVASHNIKY